MNAVVQRPNRSIQLFEPPPDAVYTIEATAQLVGVSRRVILRYCKRGLLSSVMDPARDGYYFDQRGIRRLRHIEKLRPLCCDPLASIKIILELMDKADRLYARTL